MVRGSSGGIRASRKSFLGAMFGGPFVLSRASATTMKPEESERGDRERFARSIERDYVSDSGICRYYRGGPHGEELSPIATAYAILFLSDENPRLAMRLADALIVVQAKDIDHAVVGGGVPSVVGDAGAPFYSGDALAATAAMLAVYERSGNQRYLDAARGFVRFVLKMCDGVGAGMLVSNVGFPMSYATRNGRYLNWLVPTSGMLFFSVLERFANVAGDDLVRHVFERGRKFLLKNAQSLEGPFFDHYDPGYPARRYDRRFWKWHSGQDGRRTVIGDNAFMAALGAQTMGGHAQVDRFLEWVRPSSDGGFYGYLDLDTAGSGFIVGDEPYFDVVVSGMYLALLKSANRLDHATLARVSDLFRRSRAPDGGYYWGTYADGRHTQDDARALVTGYWATNWHRAMA